MAQFAFTTFRSSLLISRGRQAFYQNLFDLTLMERPPFKAAGAWLTCGAMQVHLIVHPPGSFRTGNVDNDGCHLAFRTDDFDGALAMLTANGFREDAAEDDPLHVIVRRDGPAGFPNSSSPIPTATSSRSTARHSLVRLASVETRAATRFDKLTADYLTFLQLASIRGKLVRALPHENLAVIAQVY